MAGLSGWKQRCAYQHLRDGGLVVYPTEGVYGLGCDPDNPDAVARLLRLKRRPAHKGLILIAASEAQLTGYARFDGTEMRDRVMATWPGPVTWVLPAGERLPVWISGEHDSVAVRLTSHPLAADLCRAAGKPLVSTSANLAGQTPARSALQARVRLPLDEVMIIPGNLGGLSQPTPIYDAQSGMQLR